MTDNVIGAAAPPHDVAIHCRGVTKTYGAGDAKVIALRGVDLDVRRGELLMLAGPSGCGKTTLISIIGAILEPDSGICEVLGHDVQRLPALTAVENVAVPLLINGVSHRDAEARAREVLEAVGLGARVGALPSQLSGGQQQRVAIARALAQDPKLIVCDEPTSNLDHETGHSMMEVLRGVAKSPDRALIVVTHDARIYEFADRIARMDDGRIVEIVENKERQGLQ